MAVTVADITNRALQLIGTRTTVTTAELAASSSNEAIQSNLVYAAIRDWCLGTVNWNFARKTAQLTLAKTVPTPTVPDPWSNASPSPPWLYQYTLPTDCIIVRYFTNSDANTSRSTYLGEPKRFVVASGALLTNEASPVCIYTSQVTDPTLWPWYFERFVVAALAWSLSMALDGDKELTTSLKTSMMEFLNIGIQANLEEGLSFGDTTPEWIQALGINYPFRRQEGKSDKPSQKDRNDN